MTWAYPQTARSVKQNWKTRAALHLWREEVGREKKHKIWEWKTGFQVSKAGKMVGSVRVLAAKSDEQSLVPGIHMVERKNQLTKVVF